MAKAVQELDKEIEEAQKEYANLTNNIKRVEERIKVLLQKKYEGK